MYAFCLFYFHLQVTKKVEETLLSSSAQGWEEAFSSEFTSLNTQIQAVSQWVCNIHAELFTS